MKMPAGLSAGREVGSRGRRGLCRALWREMRVDVCIQVRARRSPCRSRPVCVPSACRRRRSSARACRPVRARPRRPSAPPCNRRRSRRELLRWRLFTEVESVCARVRAAFNEAVGVDGDLALSRLVVSWEKRLGGESTARRVGISCACRAAWLASAWAAGLRRRCKSSTTGPSATLAGSMRSTCQWRRARVRMATKSSLLSSERWPRSQTRSWIEVGRSSPCAAPRAARAAKASAARVLAWEGGFMMGSGNAKRPAGEGEPWVEGQGRRGALSRLPHLHSWL